MAHSPPLRHLVNESLVSVLHAHLRHLEQAVRGEAEQDSQFVVKNAAFLLDTVLTLAEHRYIFSPHFMLYSISS